MTTVHPQVQKARDLATMLAAAGDTNDEIRELTKPVVAALIEGGFFHMLKACSVGGMELKPSIFAQVTEAIAAADGSTGCRGRSGAPPDGASLPKRIQVRSEPTGGRLLLVSWAESPAADPNRSPRGAYQSAFDSQIGSGESMSRYSVFASFDP